jgi:hypothetical protein
MSGQGQESTILVPAKDPEQKKNENEEQKPNGDVGKGKGKDEGKDEPDIVRVMSLSLFLHVPPAREGGRRLTVGSPADDAV